jgi:hypothetical protein
VVFITIGCALVSVGLRKAVKTAEKLSSVRGTGLKPRC